MSISSLEKEVEQLKIRVLPKKVWKSRHLYPYGPNGEIGYLIIKDSELSFEPATAEEILQACQNFYKHNIIVHSHLARKYPTFEEWYKDRAKFGFR